MFKVKSRRLLQLLIWKDFFSTRFVALEASLPVLAHRTSLVHYVWYSPFLVSTASSCSSPYPSCLLHFTVSFASSSPRQLHILFQNAVCLSPCFWRHSRVPFAPLVLRCLTWSLNLPQIQSQLTPPATPSPEQVQETTQRHGQMWHREFNLELRSTRLSSGR